ncbi:FimB/Mfa2 family fimbrial subunit [Dysgonomonas sp. GY617]|uniref:FimB/Mfa2 family fimbrial subunit n=1 Tax=Dysgonomonas sp. GY617 TaxID=2780420 RepID=UPI00188463B5|nr:FimB/Mfa2 family fimbrial subunit [Dysgonomonas sp. GY617]MBF0578138.1 FimB/Mfa2 family fimbrial subunit [Dysgonomonas sp. GY617]
MRHLKYKISNQLFKYTLHSVIVLLVLLSFSACIKDDFPNCNTTLFLQINAINASGQDITASGETGEAKLYVFDQNQRLTQQMTVSVADIQNKTRIQLLIKGTNHFSIVVWSNLNGNQQADSLANGISMDQAFIQLKKNTEGYAINPDDLFFGILNIKGSNTNTDITIENTITIQRKTALLNIMVKGLNAQFANDYYFIIGGTTKDAYNFKGNLVGSPIEYQQNGEFNASNTQFISSPFRVYPLADGNSLTIYIYKGDQLIATANTNDENGANIIPIVGVTTNVLIDLRASLNVNIIITNWEEVYHWFEW